MKRLFDVCFALILLIVLSPLLLLVSMAVFLRLGRPLLFRQKRVGKNNHIFTIYKFRTMSSKRDATGALLPDHIRLSRFGRLMRKLSLDELPQLFNVIKGELSLVGPRPLLVDYLPLYTPEQSRRHHVRPGITGWAQVNGRNNLTWEQKFELDVWYVDHHSFLLDIKILFLTAVKLFKTSEVNQSGNVTMTKFSGSSSTNNKDVNK